MSGPTLLALWMLFAGAMRDAFNYNRHEYSDFENACTAASVALIAAALLWWGGDLS